METGSELSKTVAIFIVQKILLDDTGLGYICATYERFYAVGTVLSNMVGGLVEVQTVRLLKHVVRCFLRYALPDLQPIVYLPSQADILTGHLTGLATTTEPEKHCANVYRSLFGMQPSRPSSETTQPRNVAWLNCSST